MTKDIDLSEDKSIIETVDDNGEVVKFELIDILELDEKEYGLLLPVDSDDDDDEVLVMRLTQDGDDYIFEYIEDDDEFQRVADAIEKMNNSSEENKE